MGDQAKNILIGIFVISAFAIVTFMLLFLHPTVGDDGKKIKIRFSDIDKVTPGTRVTYGGKPVGEVVSIKEIDDPKQPRQARNGFVYLYEVETTVDSTVRIYNSDSVSLRTSGLLGEKSVAITPLPPKPDEPLIEIDGEIIYADESGSVEETLKEFKELSDKFEETLDAVHVFFKDVNESKLVSKTTQTVETLLGIAEAIYQKDKLVAIVDNAHTLSANAVKTWDNIDKSVASAETILGTTARGEGTVGNLLMKEDTYLRFNSILAKAETLMDDINHYGLLFQSDRNWQRVRARRANLLYTLQSPQEFRNFFNDEVDQIVTALARLNTVLDQTQCIPDFDNSLENCKFKEALAELIRRVKQMEESIRLYNTQVMDVEKCNQPVCE